jgi:hypothetical protein
MNMCVFGYSLLLLVYLTCGNEGSTFLQNTVNHVPNDATSHSSKLESQICNLFVYKGGQI